MKGYKYDKAKATGSHMDMQMAILAEALEFSKADMNDTVIDIDVERFYTHCCDKFITKIVERNVKYMKLDKEFMWYVTNMQFVCAMNNISMYNTEKLRLLEMTERFIAEYKAFLNGEAYDSNSIS